MQLKLFLKSIWNKLDFYVLGIRFHGVSGTAAWAFILTTFNSIKFLLSSAPKYALIRMSHRHDLSTSVEKRDGDSRNHHLTTTDDGHPTPRVLLVQFIGRLNLT